MRYFRIILITLVFIAGLCSCNKTLNVNADWRDITVVYGLLDTGEDTTYIKITKAFLGEGDAMQFAKIPDSSTYPDKLDVKLEEWSGNFQVNTYSFDTITITSKEPGDSIFYFPSQLVYFSKTGHLNENHTYKLKITHRNNGAIDSAITRMVHHFTIEIPDPYIKKVDYLPGHDFTVRFYPAYGGKRYQLVIRFHYGETTSTGTVQKYLDWFVLSNIQVVNPNDSLADAIEKKIPGDGFYNVVSNNIKVDPNVISRTAGTVDYIFSVASEDLNTYIEVNEPSLSIIQERPAFSNIYNGIGLFSSRNINRIDTIVLGQQTIDQLKVNPLTANLGF